MREPADGGPEGGGALLRREEVVEEAHGAYTDNISSKRQQIVNTADELALLVADVYELAGLLRRSGEEIARSEGQTQARWQLLSVASARPLTVPQAARRLGVTRQAVQRVANDLVAAGLARLAENPDHRSSALLSLTPVGERTLAAIAARARGANAELAAIAGPAELAAARATLRALSAALRA